MEEDDMPLGRPAFYGEGRLPGPSPAPPPSSSPNSCQYCSVLRQRQPQRQSQQYLQVPWMMEESTTTSRRRKRQRRTLVSTLAMSVACFLSLLIGGSEASNWAQTTGPQQQNNVIPKIPNPDVLGAVSGVVWGKNDHWSRRQGQALVIVPANTSTGTSAAALILGGDSYVRDSKFTELSGQYMNDVWYTEGAEWHTVWEAEKKNVYGAPLQKTYSHMTWNAVNRGFLPPAGVGYDEWIQCQGGFAHRDATACADTTSAPGFYVGTNMWSPRRNLGAVHLRGVLYVLGGRARDLTPLAKDRMVGGVVGHEIGQSDAFYSVSREASVLMNDVWKSTDLGVTWTLVTAGCKAPQADLLPKANDRERRYGSAATQCTSDSDCYGAEVCNTTYMACVCPMWSPREQHAVTTDGNYIYVMGGLTAPQKRYCGAYACGDPWSSAYTGFMNDVWRSLDGLTWEAVTLHAPWVGRGGHQVTVLPQTHQIFLAGGRTGRLESSKPDRYLNDLWTANLTDLSSWAAMGGPNPWAGRAGHVLSLQPPLAQNSFIPSLVVVGGENERGTLTDTWVMHLYDGPGGREWAEDYSPQQWYRQGSGSTFEYQPGSPQQYYVDTHTPVEKVVKHILPRKVEDVREGVIKPYLTGDQVRMLHEVGIFTITDMANADQRTILKLRGWDYPQVAQKDRMTFYTVCDFRALCQALIKKCTTLDDHLADFDGEAHLPRNTVPKFSKGWPTVQYAQWYGVDYTEMNPSIVAAKRAAASLAKDEETTIREWDGCEALPSTVAKRPDVPGLGPVSQVESIRDPTKELNELHCKTNPLSRAYMAGGFFQDRLWLFGGRRGHNDIWQDSWYRDDQIPFAILTQTPKTSTSNSVFRAKSDKEGAYFEYKVYMVDLFAEVRGWTKSSNRMDVSFLNKRKGGPGSGTYIFYVRAVDPAGNRDHMFVEGRNMYTWTYKNPPNYSLLLGGGGAAFGLLVLLYMEYRRRMKKRAMERYALKRMRRKFKGMQKDMEKGDEKKSKRADWRDLRKEKDKDQKKSTSLGKSTTGRTTTTTTTTSKTKTIGASSSKSGGKGAETVKKKTGGAGGDTKKTTKADSTKKATTTKSKGDVKKKKK